MIDAPAIAEQPPATLRLPNALAYVIAVFAVAVAVTLPFAVFAAGLSLREAAAEYYLQSAALFAVLGAIILRQRPGHVIGWLLVGIGGLDSFSHINDAYLLFGLEDVAGFPPAALVSSIIEWTWVPSAAGMTIGLAQVFPTGRLLSRRWRPLAWFGVAATAFLSVMFMIPGNIDSGQGGLLDVAFPLFGLATLSSLVPLTVRYRRSRGVERQQLKWVFYGLALSFPLLVIGTTGVWFGQAGAAWALPSVVILPVTITVAVVRYRLFDIDVVISKTLLVAGLAAFITVVYITIVVGVGSLVGTGSDPNLALSIAATALVAVAFQPVRRALQRLANRLVYGQRATPYDVLSGFATRVGAAESSPDTLLHLAELMAGGTGAAPARVWLRVGSQLRPAATWPAGAAEPGAAIEVTSAAETELPEADHAVQVRERGELLGVLTIAKPRGERVNDADVDLLDRLAAASGVVLRNLRLDAELTQRLADLEASRRRLVTAQDDARRRIEADLAGGTRAQLSALRGRLAELLHDADPNATPKTALLLGQLVASTDGALDTLDGLAAGVYPPRLAADGLAVALREQAAKAAVPVDVQFAGVGRYPAEVEAAVYFAVLEALQNVAKYAGAASAQVRLRQDVNLLSFEVADDGVGFDVATTPRGTGLQGMADRLDTVSGTMTVHSSAGAGTTITGLVPIDTGTDATTRTAAETGAQLAATAR